MSSFFISDLRKFKLGTQLKTLNYIVNEKQVGIKNDITIISSLNASQKLLVFEVPKVVKLIVTVRERSCSKFHIFKTYLQLSMTQELLSSCLILATYKKEIDKLKLGEVANQFCFESEHRFPI